MRYHLFPLVALLLSSPAFAQSTEESATPADSRVKLSPAAARVADELKAELPPDSEARLMLDAILSGERMGPDSGWFRVAVAQSGYGWEHVSERYDSNADGVVDVDELGGSEADFARIDRDGDRLITEEDFQWRDHSAKSAATLFQSADEDGNGKVTQQEMLGMFAAMDWEGRGFVSYDEIAEHAHPFTPPKRAGRGDGPSPDMLVMGLRNQEIGSLQPGPNVGDAAPDFTLRSLSGETVTLSEEVGEQPIVLVFGNFTCGPFRRQAGNLEKLYERYQDRAKFYLVYVREAHPSDGWAMHSNLASGIEVAQPTSDARRREVAQVCQNHMQLKIPFLVDTVDDTVGATYSGMPNRLYLIDSSGRIAFKNGRGPHGFHTRQLEQALVLMLQPE